MRTIKFRAWDKKEKFWCGYDVRGYVLVDETNKEQEAFGYFPKENIILMQYTGLKDKNGKEIYDGDILSNIHGKHFLVKWRASKARWYLENDEYSDFYCNDATTMNRKVIGNIMENPELLK